MYVIIAFLLDYEDISHPLHIEAIACFHLTLRVNKYRAYKVERAKTRLLALIDYLFNPEITNKLEFLGIEKRPDRIAKKQGLECPEYPLVKLMVVWSRRKGETPSKYETIEKVE